jgi:sugar phosphate isomerase/epimerase
MIFLSTGGFSSLSGAEVAGCFIESKITNIELSGGIAKEDQEENLFDLTSICSFHVHNYFPPPEKSFVLNLASFNEEIASLSFEHITRAIDLSEKLGSKFYSFHAGFLLDPQPKDLGKKFTKEKLNHRESAKEIFVNRVNRISDYAKKKGIIILLENNVISNSNMKHFGTNPFLMTNHFETIEIMKATHDNVRLLIDVAHLKVSSYSEGFCKNEYLNSTADYTCAYHLSDNDGLSDSNGPITLDSWFWPYIRKDLNYYSLEVYNQDIEFLKKQVELVHMKLSHL